MDSSKREFRKILSNVSRRGFDEGNGECSDPGADERVHAEEPADGRRSDQLDSLGFAGKLLAKNRRS
jgi:hypothetical protein